MTWLGKWRRTTFAGIKTRRCGSVWYTIAQKQTPSLLGLNISYRRSFSWHCRILRSRCGTLTSTKWKVECYSCLEFLAPFRGKTLIRFARHMVRPYTFGRLIGVIICLLEFPRLWCLWLVMASFIRNLQQVCNLYSYTIVIKTKKRVINLMIICKCRRWETIWCIVCEREWKQSAHDGTGAWDTSTG